MFTCINALWASPKWSPEASHPLGTSPRTGDGTPPGSQFWTVLLGFMHEGVFYNFIEEPNTRRTGLIAQNVEKVLPEVIYDNEDGKNIAYGNMVGLLIEAIKELKTEIYKLKL